MIPTSSKTLVPAGVVTQVDDHSFRGLMRLEKGQQVGVRQSAKGSTKRHDS